ncbi:MAG: hypothetical protein FWE97_00380 [Dehalococcoidia bacterium]|nr:hypothetical protein [Dehalococcoidia bacterium]
MNEAVSVTVEIMRCGKNRASDRLAAARTILEYGDKYIESSDILDLLNKGEKEAGIGQGGV